MLLIICFLYTHIHIHGFTKRERWRGRHRHMLSKRLVKVRKFPGATVNDMYHYLIPLLEKKSHHVILHVGTNDAVNYKGTVIVDTLLQLKSFIHEKLPRTNVIVSKPIMKVGTKQLENVTTGVNSKLCELDIDIIDRSHLNGTELHLDGKGIFLFAKNSIDSTWKS